MDAEPTCQSTNHKVPEECYGGLWTCSGCGRTFCANEGNEDDDFSLCDDCWKKKREEQSEWNDGSCVED